MWPPFDPGKGHARRWLIQAREAIARACRRRCVLPEQALIPLTGQPARLPCTSPPVTAGGRSGVARRNALAISLGFSLLPDVRRSSDGPDVDLARWCELGGDLLAARVLPAGRGMGCKVCGSALRPTPRVGNRLGVLRGHRRLYLISEAVPGPGGALDVNCLCGTQVCRPRLARLRSVTWSEQGSVLVDGQ